MATKRERGTEMKRRKRFSIRLVALGLAVVAIAAPTAQAVPSDPDTNRVESGLYASLDDSRQSNQVEPTVAPQAAASDEGVATSRIVSAVLLLVAGAAAIVLVTRSVRKGRFSPA